MAGQDGFVECECGKSKHYIGAQCPNDIQEQTGFYLDDETSVWYCPEHTPKEEE